MDREREKQREKQRDREREREREKEREKQREREGESGRERKLVKINHVARPGCSLTASPFLHPKLNPIPYMDPGQK